nr:uncharacterized protein LOC103408839 [Malus domestica]
MLLLWWNKLLLRPLLLQEDEVKVVVLGAVLLLSIVVERRINEDSTLVITTINAMLLEMGNDVLLLVSILSARYGKPGHPALDCYQRINAAFEGRILTKRLSAMVSFPTTLNKQKNGNWLLDIGANAHITPNLQNLVNPKKYNGNDSVGGAGPQDPDDAFSREI